MSVMAVLTQGLQNERISAGEGIQAAGNWRKRGAALSAGGKS
jgi:hypothetical protein